MAANEAAQQSKPARTTASAQADVARALDMLRDTGDIDNMLATEQAILKHERQHYANTPIMVTSLDTAIKECGRTILMLDKVRDPVAYRRLDDEHHHHSRRVGDLPKDDARTFFSGHRQRLQNLEKAVGSVEDKKVLKARRLNIEKATALYKGLQERALPEAPPKRPPPKAQGRDYDIEPG